MPAPALHRWDLAPEEAARVQIELRKRLVLAWDGRAVATVGGADVDLEEDRARAAIVVFRYPDLTPLEAVTADVPLVFPYIPGLLAFREGPAILAAWEKLKTRPDLVMFDGQGIAHPRGLGIASHMGLWLERPTVGVAKSRLYGRYTPSGSRRGDSAELRDDFDRTRIIGRVLQTKDNVNPLYISPGHLIDLPHAVEFVLACGRGYRLPEPTRWAHKVGAGERLPTDSGQQSRLF